MSTYCGRIFNMYVSIDFFKINKTFSDEVLLSEILPSIDSIIIKNLREKKETHI
jgi:hypothetical protein